MRGTFALHLNKLREGQIRSEQKAAAQEIDKVLSALSILDSLVIRTLLDSVPEFVKLFSNPAEWVRLFAVQSVQTLIDCKFAESNLMLTIIPSTAGALCNAGQEPSEEVRTELTALAVLAVKRFQHEVAVLGLLDHFRLLAEISLADQCPEVSRRGLALCRLLCGAIPLEIRPATLALAKALKPLLWHHHADIRCEAIETLTDVFRLGGRELLDDSRELPEGSHGTTMAMLTVLASDSAVAVRIRIFATMARVLLTHPDTRADERPRFLPIVLLGLTDATATAREAAAVTLRLAGDVYANDTRDIRGDVSSRPINISDLERRPEDARSLREAFERVGLSPLPLCVTEDGLAPLDATPYAGSDQWPVETNDATPPLTVTKSEVRADEFDWLDPPSSPPQKTRAVPVPTPTSTASAKPASTPTKTTETATVPRLACGCTASCCAVQRPVALRHYARCSWHRLAVAF